MSFDFSSGSVVQGWIFVSESVYDEILVFCCFVVVAWSEIVNSMQVYFLVLILYIADSLYSFLQKKKNGCEKLKTHIIDHWNSCRQKNNFRMKCRTQSPNRLIWFPDVSWFLLVFVTSIAVDRGLNLEDMSKTVSENVLYEYQASPLYLWIQGSRSRVYQSQWAKVSCMKVRLNLFIIFAQSTALKGEARKKTV